MKEQKKADRITRIPKYTWLIAAIVGVLVIIAVTLYTSFLKPKQPESPEDLTSKQLSNDANNSHLQKPPPVPFLEKMKKDNLKILHDPDSSKKKMAIAKLGGLRAKEAIPKLHEIIEQNRNADLVRASILALGNIRDQKSIPVVTSVLKHSNYDIRLAAIQSLTEFADPSLVDVFLELLRTADSKMLRIILKTLSAAKEIPDSFNSPEFIDAILTKTKSDPAKLEAVRLLKRFPGEKTLIALLDIFKNETDISIKAEAARSLGDFGNPEAVPALYADIDQNNTKLKCFVLAALVKLNQTQLLEDLSAKCLGSPDKDVRGAIISQLGEIESNQAKQVLKDHLEREKDFNLSRLTRRLIIKN